MLLSFERPGVCPSWAARRVLRHPAARELERVATRRYLENCTAVEVVFSNDGES
jgi:hypothetical protein